MMQQGDPAVPQPKDALALHALEFLLHLGPRGVDRLGDLLLCERQGDVAEPVRLSIELGQPLQPLVHTGPERWQQVGFHQVEHLGLAGVLRILDAVELERLRCAAAALVEGGDEAVDWDGGCARGGVE